MRFLVVIAFSLVFLGGCTSGPEVGDEVRRTRTIQAGVVTNKPVAIRPADAVIGRISRVNEPLRFVIVDFAGSRMPSLDQQMSVYRLDQKVAEIKISGPFLESTVAADVTAGQALPGDLVRDR